MTFWGRGLDAPRDRHFPLGCAGLGMSSLPYAWNKEVGEEGAPSRRHPVAAGAPVRAAGAAPLTFMNRAELGQPAAVRAREKRRGHAGTGREAERKGIGPRSVTAGAETCPRSPDHGDGTGPARRPTSSITRRTAAGACCQGRMKSSPREARILFNTNMRHSGRGDSRSGRGAADPRSFPHSAVLCSAPPNPRAAAMEWPA